MDEPKAVIVKYTADKMRAVVALSKGAGQITLGLILRELIHKGIVHGLNTDVMDKLAAKPVYGRYIEIASGTPVKPGVDGRVVILAGDEPPDVFGGDSKQKLNYDYKFAVVRTGEPVARRIPPKPGTDGINVLGDPIPVSPVKDVEIKGGLGVSVSPNDNNLLVAEADGVIEVKSGGVIEVQPHIEIAGDVDADSGDVSFEGHVTVRGTVRSGFAVEAQGSVVIMGEVENARIECGGNLFLHSALRGGDKAEIVCGGDMYALKIENAKITAAGDVTVDKNIENAEITCKGAVTASAIVGGSVSAVCGITVRQAGNEAGARTVLDVGGISGYVNEREGLKASIETQNLLTEGYVSELYSFVRDNMDELGLIDDDKMGQYEEFVGKLTGSISALRGYEVSIGNIETLLKKAKDCGIVADTLYPNVLLKLGFTDQSVRDILRDVHLKPVGV